MIPVEKHPLAPFLPVNAKLIMLGSFPPQQKRWSMHFYYPNFNNDMWRIMGLVFYNDEKHFVNAKEKAFMEEAIIQFLMKRGIALYDTASEVRRLNDNASDRFLEVVRATDIKILLDKIPKCSAVIATGQKAMEMLVQQFDIKAPVIGDCVEYIHDRRHLNIYRMPSTSRAYPLKLEKKADAYRRMFREAGFF